MATSPQLKSAAQDERDLLKEVRAAADLAIAGAAALAFLVTPPVGAVALVPAAIRWRTAREIAVQERLVEDPPRMDFHKPTKPEFEPILLDDRSEPLPSYIEASVVACAYEEAMIQSTEKSLGAQEKSETRYARERAEDAGHFGQLAAKALALTAERQLALQKSVNSEGFIEAEKALGKAVSQFPENSWLEAIPPPLRPSSPLEALTPEAAQWLFQAGAPAAAFSTWSEERLAGHHAFMSIWRPLLLNTTTKKRLSEEIQIESGGHPL